MSRLRRFVPLLLALAALLPFYLFTLQTIPNGAEHYYLIDVGETQIVLNTWGTLHATGYPLYVMLGSALVALQTALGVSPATAPALISLLWGLLALALLYILAMHLLSYSRTPARASRFLAAVMIILLGLTRTVWMHMVIAEIYSFGLLILALLLTLALWQPPLPGRIYGLAFAGGIGVFHHRALVLASPALIYAVWPELRTFLLSVPPRRQFFKLITLFLLGFVPYAYLPLRAAAGAEWVYGQPETWSGFWDQFLGREASRFIGPPESLEALLSNVNLVNGVLLTDLTLPGLLAGLIGLLLVIRAPQQRRAAVVFLISGLSAYIFHILFYTDILSALILPILVSLAFGWLFLADAILRLTTRFLQRRHTLSFVKPQSSVIIPFLLLAAALVSLNAPFIHDQTHDPTGLQTIALAKTAPPGSTLMLAWGPRYFAASFAQDVQGQLLDIHLVDHRADFAALLGRGPLVTPDYTFYNQPASWWEARLGGRVYLRAVAPHLVQIDTRPETAAPPNQPIRLEAEAVECTDEHINLYVTWAASEPPARDLSVFVHLLDAGGSLLDQADQFAPVYGLRPLTSWAAGEQVRDVYPLRRLPGAALIRFGLYDQPEPGQFVNEYEYELPVVCDA